MGIWPLFIILLSWMNQVLQTSFGRSQRRNNSEKQKEQLETKNFNFMLGAYHYVENRTAAHFHSWNQSADPKSFFDDLEYDHAYIQWIFPNFFKSQFNPDSFRISYKEQNLIKNSVVCQCNLLNFFDMFCRFLGLTTAYQPKEDRIRIEIADQQQFELCLFTNTHNQLRLMRILSCLSVLGQRKLALEFLAFLEQALKERGKIYRSSSLFASKYSHYAVTVEEDSTSSKFSYKDKKSYYFQGDLLCDKETNDVSVLKPCIEGRTKHALILNTAFEAIQSTRTFYEEKLEELDKALSQLNSVVQEPIGKLEAISETKVHDLSLFLSTFDQTQQIQLQELEQFFKDENQDLRVALLSQDALLDLENRPQRTEPLASQGL